MEQEQIPLGCHPFLFQNLFSMFYGIFSFFSVSLATEKKKNHRIIQAGRELLQVNRSIFKAGPALLPRKKQINKQQQQKEKRTPTTEKNQPKANKGQLQLKKKSHFTLVLAFLLLNLTS